MENILDSSYDESDLDSRSFTKPNEKSETEDNNDDEDMSELVDNDKDDKDMKLDFRRSISSQEADNENQRRKDYRSKKELEEEEREKMQWVENSVRENIIA